MNIPEITRVTLTEQRPPTMKNTKILLIGDTKIGKSRFLKKQMQNDNDQTTPTVGVEQIKYQLDSQIWAHFYDLSGHKQFQEVRIEFFKDCSVIIFMFNCGVKESLLNLENWFADAKRFNMKPNTKKIIVGLQDGRDTCDTETINRFVRVEEARQFKQDFNSNKMDPELQACIREVCSTL